MNWRNVRFLFDSAKWQQDSDITEASKRITNIYKEMKI